ncbi:hypothetical protein OKW35_001629 [Paraburkholderia sp. MM5477-R1]
MSCPGLARHSLQSSFEEALTSFIVLPASPASAEPSQIRPTDVAIGSLISLAVLDERFARLRTSLAATAKLRPCSRARRFDDRVQRENVGLKRNASMIAVMSAIFVALSLMRCVVLTTSGRPPRRPSAQLTTQ